MYGLALLLVLFMSPSGAAGLLRNAYKRLPAGFAERTMPELAVVIALWAAARFVVGGLIGEVAALVILVAGVGVVVKRDRSRRPMAEPTAADVDVQTEKRR